MLELTLPSLIELTAIGASVILGTISFLGYTVVYKKQKINWLNVLLILFMNSMITLVASEAMKMWNLGGYRTIFLPLIAYMGQYLFNWLDKRRDSIFDSAAGKIGIDTKNEKDEDNEEIEG